jgi:hypothetical protein
LIIVAAIRIWRGRFIVLTAIITADLTVAATAVVDAAVAATITFLTTAAAANLTLRAVVRAAARSGWRHRQAAACSTFQTLAAIAIALAAIADTVVETTAITADLILGAVAVVPTTLRRILPLATPVIAAQALHTFVVVLAASSWTAAGHTPLSVDAIEPFRTRATVRTDRRPANPDEIVTDHPVLLTGPALIADRRVFRTASTLFAAPILGAIAVALAADIGVGYAEVHFRMANLPILAIAIVGTAIRIGLTDATTIDAATVRTAIAILSAALLIISLAGLGARIAYHAAWADAVWPAGNAVRGRCAHTGALIAARTIRAIVIFGASRQADRDSLRRDAAEPIGTEITAVAAAAHADGVVQADGPFVAIAVRTATGERALTGTIDADLVSLTVGGRIATAWRAAGVSRPAGIELRSSISRSRIGARRTGIHPRQSRCPRRRASDRESEAEGGSNDEALHSNLRAWLWAGLG